MKRLTTLMLISILILSVTGCGKNIDDTNVIKKEQIEDTSISISNNDIKIEETEDTVSDNNTEHYEEEANDIDTEEISLENILKLPNSFRETFKERCEYEGYEYDSLISTESVGNNYIRTLKTDENSLITILDKDSKMIYTQLNCGTRSVKYSTDISASNINLDNYNSLSCKMYTTKIVDDIINNNITFEKQYEDSDFTVYNTKYIISEETAIEDEIDSQYYDIISAEKEVESQVFISRETGFICKISGVKGPLNSSKYLAILEIEPIDNIDDNTDELFNDCYKLSVTELLNMNLAFSTGYTSILDSISDIESVDYTGKIENNIGIPTDEVYDGLDIPVR